MISLITSLYKSGLYLDRYLKSAEICADFLMQNSVDFEIVAIANEPSDLEKKLLEKFSSGNNWLRVYCVPREPLYASWNRGVNLAKGDVLGFWNVDDIRYPEAIIDAINLVKNGADLVYFPFIIKWYINFLGFSAMVRKRRIYPPVFERKEFTRSMHCGPFFIFTKSLYEKVGPFDEQFRIVGDFDWCIRAAKITDKFALSAKIAGIFRVDGQGLSGGRGNVRHIAENNVVCIRHNVREKIQPVDEKLMKDYDPNKVVYKNK